MKKVIHIVEAFGGGIFTFLNDLANYTSEEYEVIIVYSEREQTPKNIKKFFNDNIKFIKSEYLEREINLKKDLKAINEIKRIIKEEKPDIVHLHSSKAGIIGRIAVNGRKVKLIYNPHGFSFLMKDTSKIKRGIYWLIEKIATLRKCTIVGCSVGEYEEAKKLSKNSICINNGINIEKLSENLNDLEKSNELNNEFKICTVARINYQKNPKLFNKIAKKNAKIEFTWIGDGELRNLLDSSNIKITGWKTRKEVLGTLKDNNIFILTSLWEGLPISLLEAMYMKKICLVSDVIGNRDVINDGINGFICDSEEAFSNRINEIIAGKYDIEKIKENAHNDVIKLYNMNNTCEKYRKLYNS